MSGKEAHLKYDSLRPISLRQHSTLSLVRLPDQQEVTLKEYSTKYFPLFFHEIMMYQRLSHPHIMPILRVGATSKGFGFLMPWMEETLAEYLENNEVDWGERLQLVRTLIELVNYLHEQGVSHGDLSPDNLMVWQGHLYLGDFGSACFYQFPIQHLRHMKPEWSSPEMSQGKSSDPRANDLWAVGMISYWILKQRFLFSEKELSSWTRESSEMTDRLQEAIDCLSLHLPVDLLSRWSALWCPSLTLEEKPFFPPRWWNQSSSPQLDLSRDLEELTPSSQLGELMARQGLLELEEWREVKKWYQGFWNGKMPIKTDWSQGELKSLWNRIHPQFGRWDPLTYPFYQASSPQITRWWEALVQDWDQALSWSELWEMSGLVVTQTPMPEWIQHRCLTLVHQAPMPMEEDTSAWGQWLNHHLREWFTA